MISIKNISPVFALILVIINTAAYVIPKITLERLPDGFQLSISDEPGMEFVAFNININKPFKSFEQGDYTEHALRSTNGRWIVKVQKPLMDNDSVFVWVHVQVHRLRYRNTAQEIIVRNTNDECNHEPNNSCADNEPIGEDNGTNTCEQSITIVQGQTVCKGQLIFEDNFDDNLNLSRWRQEVRFPLDSKDYEFVLYDSIATVKSGNLEVVPQLWNNYKPDVNFKNYTLNLGFRCTGKSNIKEECVRRTDRFNVMPPIVTARLSTANIFSFKYGRVDFRAKVPKGDWLFPLMLLEPEYNLYGPDPYQSHQLRIAFIRGNEDLIDSKGIQIGGKRVYGGAVLAKGEGYCLKSMKDTLKNTHFGDNFHIYTMIWTDRELIFQIDNEEYGRIKGGFSDLCSSIHSNINYMAPFDQEFYITLGVSAGGHSDFPENSTSHNVFKPWRNTDPRALVQFWNANSDWVSSWTSPGLKVDYVRVYAI